MYTMHNRRRFLATLSSAVAAGLIGPSNSVAQEAPPETTTIRLARNRSICIAPQYVVGGLLQAEGFTDVRYVMTDAGMGQSKMLASGEIDFTLHFSPILLIPINVLHDLGPLLPEQARELLLQPLRPLAGDVDGDGRLAQSALAGAAGWVEPSSTSST